MRGIPSGYWGKLRRDQQGQVVEWHPLTDHCADVAACCEALLGETLLRKRLAHLAGSGDLSAGQVARLSVLAALHDIGKHNVGFQNKALGAPAFRAGHVAEVTCLFDVNAGYSATAHLAEALDYERLATWVGNDVGPLLLAAIAHHGRPVPIDHVQHDSRLWPSGAQHEASPFDGVRRLVAATRIWFPEAWSEGSPLPDSVPFQHAFSGLVMLADWLGSDTDFFPYSEPGDGPRMTMARSRAAEVARRIGLSARSARAQLGPARPRFSQLSPHPPRGLQERVLELTSEESSSLTLLEAETGAGKTEAALARYLTLFHAGQVDGLYFALPTRTAATQIHSRVRAAVQRAFPEASDRPPVVLAVPGYLSVDDATGVRLPGFEVLWNDSDRERFRFRGWAAEHPKRYLAGAVVVGTVDQALLSALQVSHAHLRATALLRQLLVVDEVHASDAYMTRLLEEVLTHHLRAGGHALLMSATLGSEARFRYLKAAGLQESLPPLSRTLELPYPAITHTSGGQASSCIRLDENELARAIELRCQPWLEEPERVAEAALEAAAEGARVLVLKNTVRGCLEVQRALEDLARQRAREDLLFRCRGIVAPHHARFARDDRQALDRDLEAVFSAPEREGGCVVVATQTVQQSLDLDADLLLTDLCPMDVLLQRAGRLHRHRRRDVLRPSRFRHAVGWVLTPGERDLGLRLGKDGQARGSHGLGTVYDDLRILEATWRQLEERPGVEVPAMCRALVERTTHPEALSVIADELGELWQKHQRVIVGQASSGRRLADLNVVDRSRPFGEAAFFDQELSRKVATRLGEDDRLVSFAEPLASPFGQNVRQLTIPSHLARGLSETDQPEALEGRPGFRIGDRTFLYDRLGLRPADDEPPQEALDA